MPTLNEILGKLQKGRERSAWFTPIDDETGLPYGGLEKPFRIHLLTRKSQQWRQLEQAFQVERSVEMANNRGKVGAAAVTSYQKFLERAHAAITLEWENLITEEGEPVPCTPVTMANLYADIDLQLQLFEFTSDPRNYGIDAPPEPQGEVEDTQKKSLTGSVGA